LQGDDLRVVKPSKRRQVVIREIGTA
jgi:hypothetical protein